MIKFVYVVSLAITSFLLFIFSNEKDTIICKDKAAGKIEVIKDSARNFLGVVTNDNKILYPSSMGKDVVLAVGQKAVICYAVDSAAFISEDAPIPVHIESISYLKD
ncbi:MAG: hypothetical protein J0H29_15300 [Sphingobacteriales bacterium]|nr:hypothetical protein [Sphingobacteriales bacterium]OJY80844.1 MAG: hypothetical protein BGP14_01195 [Sphingobacteriales bacterium 44-15]